MITAVVEPRRGGDVDDDAVDDDVEVGRPQPRDDGAPHERHVRGHELQ